MENKRDYLAIPTITLLAMTSITGILSLNFEHLYKVSNMYGQSVEMYGYGIYAHDTYFQAPISIGTDFCILCVVIPLFLFSYIKYCKKKDACSEMKLFSMYGVTGYYAASIAFGLTFNQLFLAYVALFSCGLFGLFYHGMHIKITNALSITKGMKVFLAISGLALLVAWMPDVIPSIISGKSLSTVGIYTTNVTYIIDMGIVGPLCFVCIYLLTKGKPVGTIIFAGIIRLCIVVAILMIPQMICQYLSGCDMLIQTLITKSFSFMLLGIAGKVLERKMYKQLANTDKTFA